MDTDDLDFLDDAAARDSLEPLGHLALHPVGSPQSIADFAEQGSQASSGAAALAPHIPDGAGTCCVCSRWFEDMLVTALHVCCCLLLLLVVVVVVVAVVVLSSSLLLLMLLSPFMPYRLR